MTSRASGAAATVVGVARAAMPAVAFAMLFALALALMVAVLPARAQQPLDKARDRPAAADVVSRERLVNLSGSVLRIEVRRTQGGYGYGSGVVLPGERIVTNCHVTRDAVAVHVLRGGARWQADAQAARPELDVCVLRVPGLVGTPVPLAARIDVGQPVAALGYMGGMATPSVSDGVVMDLHRHQGADVIQSSTGFISGASGGGLFDARGALAGILTFRLRGGDAHYFAAPVAWLAPLLEDESRFEPVAPLPRALTYWELAADAQPRFLRAVSLAHGGLWDRLLGLAAGWARDDERDAHAHYWHGVALEKLARLDDAVRPLERAVELAARWDAPLESLGLVELQRGQPQVARNILQRLKALRDGAGDRLQNALSKACARESPSKSSSSSACSS